MGTQKPVVIGREVEDLGSPQAEHHGKSKEKAKGKKEKIEEKIKEGKFKKEKAEVSKEEIKLDKEASVPSEGQEAKSAEALAKAEKKSTKVGKAKVRSKKYKELYTLIDHAKKYDVSEALDLVKKTSSTKFDGNVEIHIRLLSKAGKPEDLRGMLKYPHPTGKKVNIVILDEKIAVEIEKTKKAEADIYLATPTIMPKIAKLAKILGPKGKMPNPKSGTITSDPEKTKAELAAGQVEYKTDSFGNLHQIIGKVSADKKALLKNFEALLSILPSDKIASITLCATMGPGIKVQI